MRQGQLKKSCHIPGAPAWEHRCVCLWLYLSRNVKRPQVQFRHYQGFQSQCYSRVQDPKEQGCFILCKKQNQTSSELNVDRAATKTQGDGCTLTCMDDATTLSQQGAPQWTRQNYSRLLDLIGFGISRFCLSLGQADLSPFQYLQKWNLPVTPLFLEACNLPDFIGSTVKNSFSGWIVSWASPISDLYCIYMRLDIRF